MLEYPTMVTVGSLDCLNQRFLSTLEFISMHCSPLKFTNKFWWFVFRTDFENFLLFLKVNSRTTLFLKVTSVLPGALSHSQPGLLEPHALVRLLIEHVFNSLK